MSANQASVGDRIRIHSNTVDVPDRTGTVVAVLGSEGGPPYRVRFESGEETILSPGSDATIETPGAAEQVEQAAEQAAEKVTEVAQNTAGATARRVADAAESVAKRFRR